MTSRLNVQIGEYAIGDGSLNDLIDFTYLLYFRLWVPGPLGDFLGDLRYFHGFIQIQDLIDRSIFRAMAGEGYNKSDLESIGVYTQQFPYPCFYRDKYEWIFSIKFANIHKP